MVKLSRLSITRRIYLLTVLMVGVLIILNIIFYELEMVQHKQQEAQRNLYLIANYLEHNLDKSFDEILAEKGAANKPIKDKVLILNSVLQPIVNEIYKYYPDLGMGYYSIELDHNLALQPNFSEDKLISLPHREPFFKVYETGRPTISKIKTSVSWEAPILNYTKPIYNNGRIVGHVWANVDLNSFYKEFIINTLLILLMGIAVLFAVFIIFKKIFDNLSSEIKQFANALASNSTEVQVELLPELEPVFYQIKNNEKALKLSEKRFSTIFQESPTMISIMRIKEQNKLKYLDVNRAWLTYTGYMREEVIGSSLLELNISDLETKKLFKQVVETGSYANQEVTYYTKEKEIRYGLSSASLININDEQCILEVISDITELMKLRKEMVRLSELNLIGEMAAGISHEVRNPMTVVRGFLQMLGEKKECESFKGYFKLMIEELDRANAIIGEFLSMGKNKASEVISQNLNTIIEAILPLIQADALRQDKNIVVELSEIPDLPLDKKEIRQLLLNLCRNGLEAMTNGGYLTIKTYLEEGNAVVAVSDQGKGIDAETLKKLGTPFFTTKEKGTGLGLGICYSIAARHNATIDISTGTQGTTFYVKFKF